MKYFSLKIQSEPHIQIFKMAALLPPGHCTTSSLAISFQSKNVTFFQDYDVITREFPPKLGNPPENHNFWPISSLNMHSDNQTQCYDTCFVENFI